MWLWFALDHALQECPYGAGVPVHLVQVSCTAHERTQLTSQCLQTKQQYNRACAHKPYLFLLHVYKKYLRVLDGTLLKRQKNSINLCKGGTLLRANMVHKSTEIFKCPWIMWVGAHLNRA